MSFKTNCGILKKTSINNSLNDFIPWRIRKANGEKNTPTAVVESVALPRVHVDFHKPWLENDDDIDTYIASFKAELDRLEATLHEQVKNGKRIKL